MLASNHSAMSFCPGSCELESPIFLSTAPSTDSCATSPNPSSRGAGAAAAYGACACPHCGELTDCYSLFAVFDGHNGVAAARMCGEQTLGLVEEGLPHVHSVPDEVRVGVGW